MKNTLLIGLFVFLTLAPMSLWGAGFSINGATVTLIGPMVFSTVDDVTLANGSFDAGSALIQVGGNWTRGTGLFVPGASTVTFQGAASSISTLTGSTTFYSLQCLTPGKTLSFAAGSTQTILGSLILTGVVGNPVRVRSSISGVYAYIVNSGTNTVNNVDAQDNNASGGLMVMARSASIDSGHTLNWFFDPLATPPPTGFSINPIRGTDAGGTEVVITGTGLTGATSVTFDGHNALSFIVDSNTQITARSPAQAAGPAIDVVVSRLSGGNAMAGSYTYFNVPVPSPLGPGSYIFPSPANGPTATIVYTMAESGTVEIRVYNEVGDLVTKVNDNKSAGPQVSTIHTDWLAPGVYFYILNLNYNSGVSDKRKLKNFFVKYFFGLTYEIEMVANRIFIDWPSQPPGVVS